MSQESEKYNPTPLTSEQASQDIATLTENKTVALSAEKNKTAYIKERVFKYKEDWWKKWEEMLNGDDKDERRTALMEYNKLQCRILPTEITGQDGEQLLINVIGYGIKNNAIAEKSEEDK